MSESADQEGGKLPWIANRVKSGLAKLVNNLSGWPNHYNFRGRHGCLGGAHPRLGSPIGTGGMKPERTGEAPWRLLGGGPAQLVVRRLVAHDPVA
jgi:hypothetical protein